MIINKYETVDAYRDAREASLDFVIQHLGPVEKKTVIAPTYVYDNAKATWSSLSKEVEQIINIRRASQYLERITKYEWDNARLWFVDAFEVKDVEFNGLKIPTQHRMRLIITNIVDEILALQYKLSI